MKKRDEEYLTCLLWGVAVWGASGIILMIWDLGFK